MRTIKPRSLMPVRTEDAQYFVDSVRGESIEVRVPHLGKEMVLQSS